MAPDRAHIACGPDAHRPGQQAGGTEDTVPADFTPDPAHEPHIADGQAPDADVDQVP